MACISTTLTGVTIDCGGVGGLKSLYIAPFDSVTGETITAGEVSAITMSAGVLFNEFAFRRGNANFVSTNNVDDAAGTSYVETVLSAQFNVMETAKRAAMVELVGSKCKVIAEDYNGQKWYLGYNGYGYGMVNAQSGAAMGDSNNYALTITFQTPELPMEFTGTVPL